MVGQLFLHRGFVHPDMMQWARPMLKSHILHRLWGVLSWYGGPVIYNTDNYEAILRAFLSEVDHLINLNGITAVKDIVPSFYAEDINWQLIDSVYSDFGYQSRERATIVLDLAHDLEKIWAGLSKEARQKVRKAGKMNVEVVEENSAEGLNRYYDVRLENASRNGLRPPSRESVLAVEPIYMHDGISKLFLAKHEGHTVAGQMLVVFNGNIQLSGICYSDRARQLRLPVNDLLQWEVIKWAKAEGHCRIDWAGFTPNPSTEKELGINRFKKKWGGKVVHYHTYDKILAYKRFAGLNWLKKQARKLDIR
jgi:lipid II:glycine glycyltransferase (peptidoglycan interpeptide bridge formation enzyme)